MNANEKDPPDRGRRTLVSYPKTPCHSYRNENAVSSSSSPDHPRSNPHGVPAKPMFLGQDD